MHAARAAAAAGELADVDAFRAARSRSASALGCCGPAISRSRSRSSTSARAARALIDSPRRARAHRVVGVRGPSAAAREARRRAEGSAMRSQPRQAAAKAASEAVPRRRRSAVRARRVGRRRSTRCTTDPDSAASRRRSRWRGPRRAPDRAAAGRRPTHPRTRELAELDGRAATLEDLAPAMSTAPQRPTSLDEQMTLDRGADRRAVRPSLGEPHASADPSRTRRPADPAETDFSDVGARGRAGRARRDARRARPARQPDDARLHAIRGRDRRLTRTGARRSDAVVHDGHAGRAARAASALRRSRHPRAIRSPLPPDDGDRDAHAARRSSAVRRPPRCRGSSDDRRTILPT